MNERIQKLMENLDLTEQEARELLADDAKVDKGEKLFELSLEQEKASKKARAAGTKKPTTYNFSNRKRKENTEKRSIITAIAGSIEDFHHSDENELTSCTEQIKIVNPERQVEFYLNGNHYSLTLTCHRAPKEGK